MPRKSTSEGKSYEGIGSKAARGEYTLVAPLDYIILEHLHPEGTMFANLYPIAHTAKQINEQALGNQLGMTIIANRMTSLGKQELIAKVVVPGTGGAQSYQRSKRGDLALKVWKESQVAPDGDA